MAEQFPSTERRSSCQYQWDSDFNQCLNTNRSIDIVGARCPGYGNEYGSGTRKRPRDTGMTCGIHQTLALKLESESQAYGDAINGSCTHITIPAWSCEAIR